MDWRNYDTDTQRYENESNRRFIKDCVIPHLRPGCKVLDIGCGPGASTHNSLLPELPNDSILYAIDADENLINTAKQKYGKSGIKFIHLDANQVHELEEDFDVIVSMFCLHLIKDQKLFWSRMASKLKEGGVIVMHTLGKNVFCDSVLSLSKMEKYAEVLKEARSRYADFIYLEDEEEARVLIEKEIKEVLPDFEVSFSLTNHTFQYQSRQDFYNNVQGDNHFRNQMGDSLAEEYVNDLMGSIQNLQGVTENDFCMALAMYEITVKKTSL